MFKNILLIGRYNTAHLGESLRRIAFFLEQKGCNVFIENSTARKNNIEDFPLYDFLAINKENTIDLAVVLGGDGTLLHSSRCLSQNKIPVIGINFGHLGFMADMTTNNMLNKLDLILDSHYKEEIRNLYEIDIKRGHEDVVSAIFFNDIAIRRGHASAVSEFSIFSNNNLLYQMKSDGMIVSSPTGSTAYSLSAGGPILHPESQVYLLMPLCPQSLSNRPIVLPNSHNLEIQIAKTTDLHLNIDGHQNIRLKNNDIITIKLSDLGVKFIHPLDYSYYENLRNKLGWNIGNA